MSLIFHLFFLCLILSMTSCSEKSDYHFKNPADAMEQYRDFHHSIAAVPQTYNRPRWQVGHKKIAVQS